ncbi:uncharacterized protein CLUP02_03057 [Colletotrichum lupini]|uniref:Uncharacterized protein n=1 Tax=Colletotrichum lupini TaxID=145971 RepID=A0A9Q8WBF4_9PEZI|nr:uncharacterized protein CLUP02_03057 [Colletotrichum lupini]UQC77588.1 hypothetical protein CLUP02_03057 [Colletotrichum lupini]
MATGARRSFAADDRRKSGRRDYGSHDRIIPHMAPVPPSPTLPLIARTWRLEDGSHPVSATSRIMIAIRHCWQWRLSVVHHWSPDWEYLFGKAWKGRKEHEAQVDPTGLHQRQAEVRIVATGPDRLTRVYRSYIPNGSPPPASHRWHPSRTRPFPARQGTFGQSLMMCAAPAPRPSLCPLHDGSDRRHLVPEPAQYFATFPKTKGAEEIQIIKWYLLKGFNTLTRLGLPIHRRSIPGEPQQKYSKHGGPATVLDYLSLQTFSKRQHGRGYPLSILKRRTNFMEHLESVKGMP